ncbi:GntR family transcriptional regulator [Orenia metallireducens]|jgi:DNA-binding FadR family transcriptional regulator|uniref:Transcriptional regulator, GntR family n=1 Tax=Orenia metallireducens TaxID=1413210 RepID=A0A285GCG5_9FIRM|nr:FadR/GntR family transcriptional regulator [Orenia metallireducens]PRX32485.1 GntR family transcriptional regulator [Orenia metallireducens]SNY21108.1 transcriptional regulator, GntR family [Orenia metallireducens]
MGNKVSDIVFEKIEEKIFSGEWGPGTKIMSEPQLAKKLNVSRMSVREAIEKMAALGLLKKKRGEGTFVNELTPAVYFNSLIPMITLDQDNYLEILEYRLIVEVESAKLCAQRCSAETINELEKLYDLMVDFKEDSDKFAELDTNFHLKIAEGAQNTLIIKVNKILKNLLEYHQKTLYTNLGPSGGIKDHKNIIDAIKNKDQELSALFMRRHIERTIEDIKRLDY